MAVLNGVVTQLLAGNTILTPDMIHRAMSGFGEARYLSPNQKAEVTKSIDKMRKTMGTIDATMEAKAYGLNVDELKLEDHLIVAKKANVTISGKKRTAYIFPRNKDGSIDMPVLYTYAKISNQIQSVPAAVLQIPISSTPKNIVLRDYLIREIGAMRNPRATRRPEITYDGIYKRLEINQSGKSAKVEMKRARDATEKILSYWISIGFIQSFSTYKKGRTIAGVTVTP